MEILRGSPPLCPHCALINRCSAVKTPVLPVDEIYVEYLFR
ncbi:MAG: hypothetical protein GPOALKHO_000125 [Sodalis sp.]|nr:MAG: hypothetical protein GPOALKHO_000125 [Sodalis sp.]